MKRIQIIELDGRPAALVAGDQAIIAQHISGADRARVQAKALYAIEIRTGGAPAPTPTNAPSATPPAPP